MYKVYIDDTLVYASGVTELNLIDPVLNLALNDAGQFTFTVPYNHPYKDLFVPIKPTVRVYREGQEQPLFIGRIIEPEGDFYNSLTFICEGALAFLNDTRQPPTVYHDISPMSYLGTLLDIHNSKVGDDRKIKLGAVTVTDPNDKLYRYTNYNSTLQEIKEDILDDLGGYCRIREEDDGLYLDILKDYGVRNEQTIEIGTNLIEFQKTQDFTELATVIIPQGAKVEELNEDEIENNENDVLDKRVEITDANEGHNYLVNQKLYDEYGYIEKTVTWDDVHMPEILLEKAKEWMAEQDFESIIIDARAFDFSYLDDGIESFKLGDEIRVISKPHDLDRWFLLSEMTICLNDVTQNTITLGGKGRAVSMSDITTDIVITTGQLNEKQVVPNKLIEQAINQATQLITSMTHGYVVVEPNQILIMDTDDPETCKNVWRWTMGGLGFSSNGINGPFETAITMDGTIVAKFIAANSIVAEQLDINYRTKVEQQINQAETNANYYTDEHLGNYWTIKEVETALDVLEGEITASVNTTLTGYATKQYLSSQLSITEGNITSQVTNNFYGALEDYSTTREMNSAIKQSADSITSSVNSTINTKLGDYYTSSQVDSKIEQSASSITTTLSRTYATKDALGNIESSVSSLENKVTADGIFTTINNGIAGSKTITNTKFSMTRTGLTIQGGGITVKNNAGTNVLSADTSGNLTMRGDFMHYGSGSYQAIGISGHEVRVYAWNQSGNYLGSLGATKDIHSNTPYIALWSDYGDDLTFGSYGSSGSNTVQEIIRLGSSGGSIGIKAIRDTINGNIDFPGGTFRVDHGLVTGNSYGDPGGGSYEGPGIILNLDKGAVMNVIEKPTYTGSVKVGGTVLTYESGALVGVIQ